MAMPNTYRAVLKSELSRPRVAHKAENRKQIAKRFGAGKLPEPDADRLEADSPDIATVAAMCPQP